MKIKIKKLSEKAIVPHYVHEGDAGMDVYSVVDEIIKKGQRKLIPTGLAFEIPLGYEIQVRPKSGLALKSGITVLNTPGTLDAGYRGELGVILFNTDEKDYEVKIGEKIAQIVLNKIETAEIEIVEALEDSSRGSGGFGSTGLKN